PSVPGSGALPANSIPATITRQVREMLAIRADRSLPCLIEMTQALVRIASPNPPGNTADVARAAERLLAEIPGIEIRRVEHVPEARGDANICGDVGSPMVVRFGEKGLMWIEIEAHGVAAHGAHVHKGVNAIDRLRTALDRVKELERLPVAAPDAVVRAIEAARPISEKLSGVGE